jgi:hypothetical protein
LAYRSPNDPLALDRYTVGESAVRSGYGQKLESTTQEVEGKKGDERLTLTKKGNTKEHERHERTRRNKEET